MGLVREVDVGQRGEDSLDLSTTEGSRRHTPGSVERDESSVEKTCGVRGVRKQRTKTLVSGTFGKTE